MKIITINPTEAFLKSSECLAGKLVTYSDKQLEHLQPLAKFVSRYSEYQAPSWQYDIVANAKRIYAFIEEAREYKGLSVFIDPKFHVKQRTTEETFRKELGRNYVGLYKRDGMPSKPDVYMVDGEYPEHQEFLEYMASLLESDQFRNLTYWTDGALLDEATKRIPNLPVKNLSGTFGKEKDPIKHTPLGDYLEA